ASRSATRARFPGSPSGSSPVGWSPAFGSDGTGTVAGVGVGVAGVGSPDGCAAVVSLMVLLRIARSSHSPASHRGGSGIRRRGGRSVEVARHPVAHPGVVSLALLRGHPRRPLGSYVGHDRYLGSVRVPGWDRDTAAVIVRGEPHRGLLVDPAAAGEHPAEVTRAGSGLPVPTHSRRVTPG